jgi:hypothetical protein
MRDEDYSAVIDGKDYHYTFKPHGSCDGYYHFFINDMYLGDVVKFPTGWKAVCIHTKSIYGTVGGFKTRIDACGFILQVCRIEDFYKGDVN